MIYLRCALCNKQLVTLDANKPATCWDCMVDQGLPSVWSGHEGPCAFPKGSVRRLKSLIEAEEWGLIHDALNRISWGPHGAIFVSKTSPIASTNTTVRVYVNSRLLLEQDPYGRLLTLSGKEGEDLYQQKKKERQIFAREYALRREAMLQRFVEGLPVYYEDGQQGGTFRVPLDMAFRIGARVLNDFPATQPLERNCYIDLPQVNSGIWEGEVVVVQDGRYLKMLCYETLKAKEKEEEADRILERELRKAEKHMARARTGRRPKRAVAKALRQQDKALCREM